MVNYVSKSPFYGRTKTDISKEDLIFYSDKKKVMPNATSDKFYTALENAEYLVNIPAMKAHDAAGISLFAKNHFGSQTRYNAWHLHPGLNNMDPLRRKYGVYRVLVDMMGNKHTGEKNLIFILDALWTGTNWDGKPVKFQMSPFNNHWTSSVFVSLDQVAIESVAFDFMRAEFSNKDSYLPYVNQRGTDDYLHQAADSKNWPEGIVYCPNGDGIKMSDSMGVHEHWNSPEDKKYTRDLGAGEGIEMVRIFQNIDNTTT